MTPETVRKLYEVDGLSSNAIAIMAGMSTRAIRYRLAKQGVEMRDHRYLRKWTPEKKEQLRNLWFAGMMLKDIGREIGGFSAGAVDAKRRDMGLPPRRVCIQPSQNNVTRLPVRTPPPLKLGNVKHCRWPEGDPKHPDFHFCDAKTKHGSSYCPDHHARAYRPQVQAAE